jgi:hypothetical protein
LGIVDNSDLGFAASGRSWLTIAHGLSGKSEVSISNAGSAGSCASWTTAVQPGLYDVAATWTAASYLSANVVYAVYDASYDLLGYGIVNQQAAPNEFVSQGATWDRLGTFQVATGNLLHVYVWNSAADGQVCADAVQITPASAITIDNANQGNPSFSAQGGWAPQSEGLYGSSLLSSSTAGTAHSMAIWTTNVQPGWYDLAATWTASGSLSAGAVYAVYDANWNLLSYGIANQQTVPNQFTDQGVGWDRLGTFNVTSGNLLRVILWNSAADGQVCADAVRIEPVRALIINNGDQGSSSFVAQGPWTPSSQGFGGSSLISSSAPGSNASAAFWTTSLAAGTYNFSSTWTASNSLATSVTYAIYDANWNLLGYGTVNQQTAPNQFTDQGVGWTNVGGTIDVPGGPVHVALFDSSNTGNVCADAVRIQPA